MFAEMASKALLVGTKTLCGLWLLSVMIASSFSSSTALFSFPVLTLFGGLLWGDTLLLSRPLCDKFGFTRGRRYPGLAPAIDPSCEVLLGAGALLCSVPRRVGTKWYC